MARVAGVDLPKEKRIDIALSYIYGIGRFLAGRIVSEAAVDPSKRVKNLSEEEVSKLNTIIVKNFKVEGDLKRETQENVKRLINIGSYRGYRHRRGLPVRGQRTKTNGRTRRGKRKTVGSARAVANPQAAPTE
jgi:small subunit ribosomal protein S13